MTVPHLQGSGRVGVLQVLDPEDGSMVSEIDAVLLSQVEEVVEHAGQAAAATAGLPSHVRAAALDHAAAELERRAEEFAGTIAREGLTSVTDAGVAGGWIGHAPGELAAYQSAREHAVLRTRMQVMPVIDALAGLGGHSGEPEHLGPGVGVRTGWGDEWLQLGPVKVFTDGSILGRTARMSEPYEGCPGYHGYLQEDQESLHRRVLQAYAAGWSLALHAVGDAALDLALDVIEEGITRHGTRRVPNRVKHGAVVRPDQVARLAALDVACVVQPAFIPTFGEGMRRAIGRHRSTWSHRARSLLDVGLPVALSSDRPVAPGALLSGIQAFIERITEDGLPYGPDERLTAGQAVRAATEGSSRVTGQHGRKGRLVAGQLADMVFLQDHPADVAVEDIHSIPVLATAVGGVFAHHQSGF